MFFSKIGSYLGFGFWDLRPPFRNLRPMRNRFLLLVIGISLGFGAWDLGFTSAVSGFASNA
jgi:hypothetical protein